MCGHFGDLTRVRFYLLYPHVTMGQSYFSCGSILVTEWVAPCVAPCDVAALEHVRVEQDRAKTQLFIPGHSSNIEGSLTASGSQGYFSFP